MQPQIKTEHRGFELIYQNDDKWVIGGDIGKDRRSFDKLSDAKIYINDILKDEFNRFDVFFREGFGSEFKRMTATSRPDNKHLWLIDREQRRVLAHINYCYQLNATNERIIEQLKLADESIEILKDEKELLIRKMELYKATEVKQCQI